MSSMTIPILMDPRDLQALSDYLDAFGRRAARAELLPILKTHLEPLVASEKAYLSGHTQSGALVQSLAARAGAGDRPGILSVFAAPTATVKQLRATWGQGRRQQRRWAAGLEGKGRRSVFYGPIVHQGHRIVVRGADGQLHDTGKRTRPVPFAQQAVDALGEQQAEAAGEAILDHLMGG